MNKFAFEVLDLINRNGLDNSCWGVCDGFNRQSFDNDELDMYYEGLFLYVWVSIDDSDFSFTQMTSFDNNNFLRINVFKENNNIDGVYYFFKLD